MPTGRRLATMALALAAAGLWLVPPAVGEQPAGWSFDAALPGNSDSPFAGEPLSARPLAHPLDHGLDHDAPLARTVTETAAIDEAAVEEERAPSGGHPPGLLQRVFFQIEEVPELEVQVRPGPELDMPFRPLTPPPPDDAPPRWFDKLRITGYAQLRYNATTHRAAGSAPAQHAGDPSVGPNQNFLIRRARLIFAAEVSDHLAVYLQPDFASTPPGSPDANHFVQIRDWYADVFLDKERVYRVRVGQSKIPYGWENMQSSSRRLPLDRNDAFNSAARNERDLGVFYYWTPKYVQEVFGFLADEGLKPSGDYGAFGIGVYNGQGGSFREQNDDVHFISRMTWPFVSANGQVLELGVQGYTGRFVVLGSPIRAGGTGDVLVPEGTRDLQGRRGHVDQRLGWTAVYYPQPMGFQAEWTIGRGPALNADQTEIERRFLQGGYVMAMYRYVGRHGIWFPFVRWQHFRGGYKSARNAPFSEIDELELGMEWEIRPEMRLTTIYTFTDRTNLTEMTGLGRPSYEQFEGQLLRTQFQFNY